MTAKTDKQDDKVQPTELTDPTATILFVVFVGILGYLLLASTVGLYPWFLVLGTIAFFPTWDAIITFLVLLVVMFLSLIGGLVRMRYSIILVGIVAVVAVFLITFYTLLLVSGFMTPIPP
ncbi:MAG: hypothetical protein ACFFCO_01315 [Promethearchaeota archaeon]